MSEQTDDFLAHYGVPGMRWGKRKGGSTTSGKKASVSADAKEVASIRTKKPSQMSNQELQKVNTRINLEQQYSRLNPSKVTKGKQTATALLATASIGVSAYNLVKSPAGQAAIKTAKNAIYKANFASGKTLGIGS